MSICDKCIEVCRATSSRKECVLFKGNDMKERERLIKEIINTFGMRTDGVAFKLGTPDNIADFILADRKRVLDEVEKPLKEYLNIDKSGWIGRPSSGYTHENVMEDAIAKIEELKGN